MTIKPFALLLSFFAVLTQASSASAITGTWTGELKSGADTVPAIYKFGSSGNPIFMYETRDGTREAELTHPGQSFRFIPPGGGVVTVSVEALSVTPESVSYTMAMSHERSGGGTLEQAEARAVASFLLAGAGLKTTLTIRSQHVMSQPGIVVPGDLQEVTLEGTLSKQ
jgi:hypothetical protein